MYVTSYKIIVDIVENDATMKINSIQSYVKKEGIYYDKSI